MNEAQIYTGDALAVLRTMADESVHCCVTSPPYWGLRDYGVDGQIGLEATLTEYVTTMVAVFAEVRRVLRDDGTLWLNLGDKYSEGGERPRKTLLGMPWRVAFALVDAGWFLRNDEVWCKPNAMPESVTDRATRAHEYVFMLNAGSRCYYDQKAVAEPAVFGDHPRNVETQPQAPGQPAHTGLRKQHRRYKQDGHGRRHQGFNERWDQMMRREQCSGTRNRRTWRVVATRPNTEAHFAMFPPDLIKPYILASCPPGGVVLDPFCGTGTTLAVAQSLGRQGVGIELNPDYVAMAQRRCAQGYLDLEGVTA